MTTVLQHENIRLVLIKDEPEGNCDQCGTHAEVRPYGPNGMRICVECGMKDKPGTVRRMFKHLYDIDLSDEEANEISTAF